MPEKHSKKDLFGSQLRRCQSIERAWQCKATNIVVAGKQRHGIQDITREEGAREGQGNIQPQGHAPRDLLVSHLYFSPPADSATGLGIHHGMNLFIGPDPHVLVISGNLSLHPKVCSGLLKSPEYFSIQSN
jgi:hypothetical protein